MPYVPIPQGVLSVTTFMSEPSRYRRVTKTNGKVTTGSQALAANAQASRGSVIRAKGKPTLIRGGKWNPCRAYSRLASKVFYHPGTTQYDTSSYTEVWSGIPQPLGVWAPHSLLLPTLPGDGYTWTGTYPSMTQQMRSRIDTDLLIKAGRRKVNFGEMIGEGRKTIKDLSESVSTLVKAYKAARKGQFWRVAKLLKKPRLRFPKGTSTANKWLAYQYGWKPLMHDIYDSYQYFKEGCDKRLSVLAVSRSISTQVDNDYGPSSDFKIRRERVEARFTGKLFFRIADNDLNLLTQVGLINPAEVLWAIVPFSFVVDWLIPVGSVLEALSARVGLTFIDGYYGVKLNCIQRHRNCRRRPSGYPLPTTSSCEIGGDKTAYVRTRMPSLPWPGITIRNPFSTTHVANALALVTSLLGGRR